MGKHPDKDTLDLFAGEALRDEGMERVALNNDELMVKALILIRALPPGWTGQMEDLRGEIEAIAKPTHPGFYGSLTRNAKSLRLLKATGLRVKMRRAQSHARVTDQLIRL